MAWMEKQLESLTELVKELTRERAMNEQQMSRRISTSSVNQKGILIWFHHFSLIGDELLNERREKNLEWVTKVTDDVISSSKIYSIENNSRVPTCVNSNIKHKKRIKKRKIVSFFSDWWTSLGMFSFFLARHQWQTIASTPVWIKSQNKYFTSRSWQCQTNATLIARDVQSTTTECLSEDRSKSSRRSAALQIRNRFL